MKRNFRQTLGALLFDMPQYLYYLLSGKKNGIPNWIFIKNRNEVLEIPNTRNGVKCQWQWTSDLYLPKLYPVFGQKLLKKAFDDFPISFGQNRHLLGELKPDVSFVIGHRGIERAPLLLKTIESIAGQKNCNIECIVIEQDTEPLIEEMLPTWVKYLFTPIPYPDMSYSRSLAFNEGAKQASADCLIFHDNDMLIPNCYAQKALNIINQGYEFINLKRFIFYLSKSSSKSYLENISNINDIEFDAIVQNLEGGGSFSASKEAYFEIGGFDERFVGWGGEDNEFWERAQTRKLWPYTFLPIIHLWHHAQPEKRAVQNSQGKTLYSELSQQSPSQRIRYLREHS